MAFTASDWGQQAEYEINSGQVPSSQSSVPILITMDTASFPSSMLDAGGTSALNGGGDIRVSTDTAGANQLAIEIVSCIVSGTPANQELIMWVLVPTVDDLEKIYVTWNRAGQSQPGNAAPFGRNAVWVEGSKYNAADGTDSSGDTDLAVNSTTADTAFGYGTGWKTNGSFQSSAIGSGNLNLSAATEYSIDFWINASPSQGNWIGFCSISDGTGTGQFAIARASSSSSLDTRHSGLLVGFPGFSNIADGNDHKVTFTWGGSSTNLDLYIDGVFVSSGLRSSTPPHTNTATFIAKLAAERAGLAINASFEFYGVNKTARSADRIAAEYNNQSDQAAWATFGTPYVPSAGGTTTLYKLPKQYSTDFKFPRVKPRGDVEIDWSNPITKTLVSYFLLDKAPLRDLVQNDDTYELDTGNSLLADARGRHVYFNGTSAANIATKGLGSHFNGNNQITVSMWVNQSLSSSGRDGLLQIAQGSATQDVFSLDMESSFRPTMELRFTSSNTGTFTSSGTVTRGVWNLITFVYDGANAMWYINGQLDSTTAETRNFVSTNSPSYNIGLGGVRYWHGKLSEIGLFTGALTARQVKSLYEDQSQILKPKTLPVYYTTSAATGIEITPTTVNVDYTATSTDVNTPQEVSVSSVNFDYDALSPSVVVSGAVEVTASGNNVFYQELNPIVSVSAEIVVVPSSSNTEYNTPNVTILVSTTIEVNPSSVNVQYNTYQAYVVNEDVTIECACAYEGVILDYISFNGIITGDISGVGIIDDTNIGLVGAIDGSDIGLESELCHCD